MVSSPPTASPAERRWACDIIEPIIKRADPGLGLLLTPESTPDQFHFYIHKEGRSLPLILSREEIAAATTNPEPIAQRATELSVELAPRRGKIQLGKIQRSDINSHSLWTQ